MDSDTTRTVDEIRAGRPATRQAGGGARGECVDSMKPANIARRGIDDAKNLVAGEFRAVRDELQDENGWRVDRLMIIGGAILGVVLFAATLSAVGRRKRS